MYDRAHARPHRPLPRVCAVGTVGSLLAAVLLTLVSTPASARPRGHDGVESRVVSLINVHRADAGLAPMRASRRLAHAADAHSRDMARRGFFAHSSSSGLGFAARVRRFASAAYFGENLAYVPHAQPGGQAESVVGMWMRSPPHRAAILSSAFGRVGVARRSGRIGRVRATVFTADFASRR